MKISKNTFAIYAAMLALTLTFPIASSVALGQEGNPGQSNPGYSAAPSAVNPKAVDNATLKRAARAFVKVKQIAQREQRLLSGTSDDDTKQKVMQRADSEALATVKAEGLQPQEYDEVLQLVLADNDLEQRFLSYVDEVKPSPSDAD